MHVRLAGHVRPRVDVVYNLPRGVGHGDDSSTSTITGQSLETFGWWTIFIDEEHWGWIRRDAVPNDMADTYASSRSNTLLTC